MKLIVLLFSMISFASNAQEKLLWSIFHPVKKEWVELGEKGTVQEALISSGELPDPFYGRNEEAFLWIENHEWKFKSLFFINKEQLKNEFIELEFPSIDTYANVYLNDSLILTTENAFKPYSTQIKSIVKEGVNEITVVFTSPVVYHKQMYERANYHLPAPNDVGDIAIAPYTRKPQYQFGWDWSLRMNTMGFNKPVLIHSYKHARIINKSTRIISLKNDTAIVAFDIELSNNTLNKIEWKSQLYGSEIITGKNGKFTREVTIVQPELWWPRGQGKQNLYTDNIALLTVDKELIKSVNLKFGVKIAELIQEKDEWGTSYYFKINGRNVFAKGADYIPQDIFPARVTDSALISMVDVMVASNFNMVRIWGGGYYPDETFFEACDEKGIMVWQDLMFACAMYPGDAKFTCNVKEELRYQITRISGHPSVVLFNGNNEVDVAWKNWGFQKKYQLNGDNSKEIEDAYQLVFKEIAPDIVTTNSSIPYVHTSPLSNWGKDEFYNHGSQHYWGVWHGKDPIEDFGKKIGRFNAEYGFQSFPEFNTLSAFSEKEDWNLNSEVMKHHQKSYVGNGMILKHTKLLFGEPKDFEEFVYYSQLTQAKAVSIAVVGHRLDAPRCGGTLYWQLNDCWPAPTWSSIDYFGNWKALQYTIQKDYQDVAILAKYDGLKDKRLFVISDSPETRSAKLICSAYSLDGKVLFQMKKKLLLNVASKFEIQFSKEEMELIRMNNCQLVCDYEDDKNLRFTRTFDFINQDYEKATSADFELTVISPELGGDSLIVKVLVKKFAADFWLSSTQFNLHFDRNFESLLPGNYEFKLKGRKSIEKEDLKLMLLKHMNYNLSFKKI